MRSVFDEENVMSKSTFIMITVVVVISLSILLLWYFKPKSTLQSEPSINEVLQTQQLEKAQVVVEPTVYEVLPETTVTAKTEQTAEQLLQQRDAVYAELGGIAMQMMEGQKPDLRHVSDLIQQHQTLVQKGVISLSDAQTNLEFWIKVFPEMSHELNVYLKQLDQVTKK